MIIPTKVIVVAAILFDGDGRMLLTQRAAHQHQAGKWEFPGGKVENNESPLQALARELQEELGIGINPEDCQSYQQVHYTYPDKQVQIDFYVVKHFEGEPQGLEGQPLVWVTRDQAAKYHLPAANQSVMQALQKGWPH